MEENLETWKYAQRRRGMKVQPKQDRCVNQRKTDEKVTMEAAEVVKVNSIQYYLYRKNFLTGRNPWKNRAHGGAGNC